MSKNLFTFAAENNKRKYDQILSASQKESVRFVFTAYKYKPTEHLYRIFESRPRFQRPVPQKIRSVKLSG